MQNTRYMHQLDDDDAGVCSFPQTLTCLNVLAQTHRRRIHKRCHDPQYERSGIHQLLGVHAQRHSHAQLNNQIEFPVHLNSSNERKNSADKIDDDDDDVEDEAPAAFQLLFSVESNAY